MKLPWEKKHLCWGITAFLTIIASILFYMVLQRWSVVSGVLGLITQSLAPITYGLILAYLINPLLNWIEHGVVFPVVAAIAKKKNRRVHNISRMISLALAWSLSIAVIYALLALVLPEITESIESLIVSLPEYASHAMEWGGDLLKKNPTIQAFLLQLIEGFSSNVESITSKLHEILPNIDTFLAGVTSSLYNVVSAILNVLIGVIVSVYVLKDKEKFTAQSKKVLYSVLPIGKANNVIAIFRMTHDKFGNFITGKIFDSMIIGVICFVVVTIFGMPYPALISVIVGVTNVIPFFGPFIGAIPSAILILFAEPGKCIGFIIFIILLQQFDGNILGPKILGSSTGISSFWVLFSILVGSGLFGIWGMVCSVPIFAVIYNLVREGCHDSLTKKGVDYTSETYEKIDHIDENTKSPVWFENITER